VRNFPPAFLLRLAGLAFLTVLFWFFCLRSLIVLPAKDYQVKMKAVSTALKAQRLLGERLKGEEYTFITTTMGSYQAKEMSLHPDFAALTVELLHEAGVRRGDRVAVNFSGSFPALNVAVLAAADAIGARPVITSSLGASTWGANRPEDTWLDMEAELYRQGLWPWRSAAAFPGGEGDRGGGLPEEGLAAIYRAMRRAGLPARQSVSLEQAIAERLSVYRENGSLPRALVNVGGSHVIFGGEGLTPLRQGLTTGFYQEGVWAADGLAKEFIKERKPVIHFINILKLAGQYGIKKDAPYGKSSVFYKQAAPFWLRSLIIFWLLGVFFLLKTGGSRGWWTKPFKTVNSTVY
jgi:poly-gamma-glutamate system protein